MDHRHRNGRLRSGLNAGVFGLAGNASSQNAAAKFWTLSKKKRDKELHYISSGNDGSCGGKNILGTAATKQFGTYSGPAGRGCRTASKRIRKPSLDSAQTISNLRPGISRTNRRKDKTLKAYGFAIARPYRSTSAGEKAILLTGFLTE